MRVYRVYGPLKDGRRDLIGSVTARSELDAISQFPNRAAIAIEVSLIDNSHNYRSFS